MGGHHKKKSDKKHDKKKKKKSSKKKDRSPSTSSSDSTSRSSSIETKKEKKTTTAVDVPTYDFKNWSLAQKSESLMYDNKHENEEKTSTFFWRKKHQISGVDKLDTEQLNTLNKQKQEEARKELEKLKKRKIEREREKEEREREREFLQRQKEAEYHQVWEKNEHSFHLQQVKLRSKIRTEEARAKPIDLLAKYISDEDDDLVVDMHEPYTYLNGLTIRDLEDLLVDIKVYTDLENNKNIEYWNDITIITEDELKKLQKLDPSSTDHAGDRREGINQSVMQDVCAQFKGKSCEQLNILQQTISAKIKDEAGIDIGFWESVLSQLKAAMARARLRERHQLVLVNKLNKLKSQQGLSHSTTGVEDESDYMVRKIFPIDEKKTSDDVNVSKSDEEQEKKDHSFEESDEESLLLEETAEELCLRAYSLGNYSPKLIKQDTLDFDTFIVTPEEDFKRLEFKRMQVIGTGSVKPDTEEEFEKKARENMDGLSSAAAAIAVASSEEENTATFSVEIPVEHQYLWSDKYRPRKPRYYNRVHTGYDWNQYNKKHYDTDNPPPKTVQGYKFNIFYPDVIDKTKTPTYSITVCKDNLDFAVLRFHAGAPYEDVAFKIVNREWDISHRHGFRNQFQNGILQLWFHFRKWKYRR